MRVRYIPLGGICQRVGRDVTTNWHPDHGYSVYPWACTIHRDDATYTATLVLRYVYDCLGSPNAGASVSMLVLESEEYYPAAPHVDLKG